MTIVVYSLVLGLLPIAFLVIKKISYIALGYFYLAFSLNLIASVLKTVFVIVVDVLFLICTFLPGDGNEAIGALIQNYIREIEDLR